MTILEASDSKSWYKRLTGRVATRWVLSPRVLRIMLNLSTLSVRGHSSSRWGMDSGRDGIAVLVQNCPGINENVNESFIPGTQHKQGGFGTL